jgi:hypothetical protein
MTPASARKRAMPYATRTAAPARTSPLTSSMSAWPSPAEPVPTWKLNAPSITCPSAEVTRQTTAYSPSDSSGTSATTMVSSSPARGAPSSIAARSPS